MCPHVYLEGTTLCAFVFTLIAAEGLFSGVNKNVNFQKSSRIERVVTHGASVVFLSSLSLGCGRHCVEADLLLFQLCLSCIRTLD